MGSALAGIINCAVGSPFAVPTISALVPVEVADAAVGGEVDAVEAVEAVEAVVEPAVDKGDFSINEKKTNLGGKCSTSKRKLP